MGTWGIDLYDDDFACDIRKEYLERLKSGKKNDIITKELIEEYANDLDSSETMSFWIVLADTQWNQGLLLPEVKERALYYLNNQKLMHKLLSEWGELYNCKKEEYDKISKKIESKMPKPKKTRNRRLYECKWNIGDVFQYKLSRDDDITYKENFIYFIKCGEDVWHPGHICPEVYVFRGVYNSQQSIEQIKRVKIMPQFFVPEVYKDKTITRNVFCRLLLLNTSEKNIPHEHIIYLGNICFKDISNQECKDARGISRKPIEWKDFDSYIVENWETWKDSFDVLDEKYDLSIEL